MANESEKDSLANENGIQLGTGLPLPLGDEPVKPEQKRLPKSQVEKKEVTACSEDRRAEYAEVNSNIRHYSSLRFAIITVFFAATGGLASIAFNAFGFQTSNLYLVKVAARIAALLVTTLFLQYEVLVGGVLAHNRKVGTALELQMGLTQISGRSPTRIVIAHWFARVLYAAFLIFWAAMIWEIMRPTPSPCDDCI